MTGIFLFFLFLNFLPWPAKAVEISNFNLSPGCDNKTDNPVNCVPGQIVIEARWAALDNALCPTVSENKCYYRILRKESSPTGSFVTLVSNLTYISGASAVWRDTGGGSYPLKERTNYTYKIEARDASGGTIYGTSGEKETMSKVCGCPHPFVLYGASNDCDGNISQIGLSWQETAIEVRDGRGTSILAPHYGIYRWNGPCSSSSCYDPSNAVGFIDRAIACQAGKCFFVDGNNSAKRLEFNKSYYYKVVAYSEGAERASANQLTPIAAFCPKPVIPSNSATPPGLELDCNPLQLKLRWDDCAGATNPAACQQSRLNVPIFYNIYKNTNENGYIWINSLAANSSQSPCQWQSNKFSCQFSDSIKSNFSYSYYVKAAGQGWTLDSNYSELLTIIPGACAVQINPPDYLWVTPFCDSLDNNKPKMTLSWGYTATPPANIRRYYIHKYRCTNPPTCSSWQAITKDGNTTYYDSYNTTAEDVIWVDGSQSYHTVIAGETYRYQVKTETTDGVSNPTPPSTSVKAREDCVSPPHTATPVLTLGASCSNLAPVMILNWTPPKTDGNGDGNSDGTTDDIFVYHILKNGVLYTDTANSDSYIDTFNVSPGQPYYYQIIADGPGGPAASNLTPTVVSRDDCNKPTPFKLITVAKSCLPPSQHQVYLDWQNSSNLSRYEVFRKATNSPPDCTTSEGRLSAGLITNLNVTNFTDTENLVEGATYYYFIRASVDGGSCTLATLASGVSNAVTIPYTTPGQPSGLAATPQCLNSWQSSIRLTWTVDPAVASYKLCYNTSPAVTEANCTQSLLSTGSYDFTNNVTVGQNYYFAIQADSGCAKSLSAVVGPTTARCCPPPSFSINGTATCQSTAAAQHTLSWTTHSSAESYEVFQSANNLDFSSLGLRVSPFNTLVGPNNTFYYFVRAKATCGLEYTNSNTSQLAINCLQSASPTLTLSSTSCIGGYPAIAFSWSQSANATSYSIYRCQGTSCPPNTEIKSGYNGTSYNDIGGEGQAPISGNLYSYQIKAINANSNSFNLSNSIQNISAPYCPPGPFILSSATNCDPVANRPIFKLKWTKAAEPATLDKYKIYRVTGFISGRGPSDPVVAEKAGTFFDQWWTDDTFPPGEPINDQNYSYYVEAVAKNNAGSSYSNIVNLKKDCQGPTGTLALTANASCDANDDPYVDLDWTMSNLTDVASYKLYRGGQLIYTDATISAVETYPDSNIESGSSYNYAVRACDQNNLCTSDSVVNNVSAPYCPVGIPADLQVGAICQEVDLPAVNLSWQPAKNATQYTVVRKIGGVINKTYSVTATSKSDNEVVGGTTYTYQIIAKNPANLCATNDCAVCAGQCSTVQTASVPTCGVSEPVLFADRYCSGEGVPADLKCFSQGDQYGTYAHFCWTADESAGAPLWCRLERQTPEGWWLVKTPTFHSQGIYDSGSSTVDNIATTQRNNITNRAYSALSFYDFYESVVLGRSGVSMVPSRIQLLAGIYPVGPYPEASRNVTLDFWFKIGPYSCLTNRDDLFYSFLWKHSGDQTQPDFRISYNAINNGGYQDDLVMLKTDELVIVAPESERATLINYPEPGGGLTCDTWHHFLWTQDQTSGQTQVYLDKTLAYNGLWGRNFTRNNNLYFGCESFFMPGTASYFRVPETIFDEIKIWPDKIINSRQVQKLYDQDYTKLTTWPVLKNVIAVTTSAGGYHTCALLEDKTVKCWGENGFGQLGLGNTNSPQLNPVSVPNLSNVKAVAVGFFHTCALLEDKTVKCWGENYYGQVGDGTTVTLALSPVFVHDVSVSGVVWADYHTSYDDFETIEGGQYNYQVTCGYTGGATRTTPGNFAFPWCQPDIDFPQTNDLQGICSDWADKNKNIVADQTADCSGGYSDDTEEIAESKYQPQAPYALLAWDYLGGAETVEVKRYQEGQSETEAITLASFSVDPTDPNKASSDIQCPEGHCYCQDRSVQEADLSQKFHYFVKAIGPPPSRREAKLYFPSADPALSKSFGLTCSNDYGTEKFLLLNPCQAGQPTVKIVLKPNSGPAANIKSYWEGNAEILTISQGLRSVTKEGVALSEDMAGNDDSATQLNATGFANPYGAVSWSALGNISTDPNLSQEPIALSMWVKFDSAYQAEKEILFYGLNPASVWCEGCGDEPQEYLRLSRSGTSLTAADEGELEIASRASAYVDKRYYTDYILSDTTSWHHLKGVWQNNGANKKMKFWLDFNFIGEMIIDTPFPIPATSGYNIYLGDHYKNSDTSPLTHNSITAKARLDEVYISKDSGNDPYYYEIFRKAPSEQTYRHLVTLDSNAYQWFERELTAESEYAYKVRLIPTDQNKLSLTLATFENTPDNIILPADCRPEYGPFDFQALSSSCLASQPVINLSWQDNKAPSAENNYSLLADLPSGVVYISIPPANCTKNSPNEPYQCHYVYQLPAETDYFHEHMFYLIREAEEDEIANGAPDFFLTSLAEAVRPARCFDELPKWPDPDNLSGNACCAENGLCTSNGPEPAVFLNWQDAQYTNYYEIYRCQLGVSLCSDLSDFILMGSVEETVVCLNAGSQTGSLCRFDWECGSGTCGETSYNLTDDQVAAGATYVYRIFAYGNGSQEANNSLIVITPSFGREAGNCKLIPATPFITKIERGCTATDEPFHRLWWDYANQYGTEVAPSGDPNPNIIIDHWLIERQPPNGSFDLVKEFYPTNLPLPLVSTNFITPFNNNLVAGHFYNYGVKAVTQVDSEFFESYPSPTVGAMAPFCTDPPKNDIFNFGIDEYSSCNKISFKFETAADDFAEGYEIYQLANLPSLAKFNYQNCQYNYSNFSQGELKCSYSSSCSCAGVGSVCDFCKNKKLNDQGLLIKEIIQARGPTTYTFEAENFAQNTTLYWAVVPFNSRGYYDSIEGGNIIPIQTNLCAQAPISSTFTAVSKCPSTVELKWKNPDESIYGYKIYRKKLEESDASYLLLADKDEDSNEVKEACDIPNKSSCFNLYQDELSQALTEIYKYKIVSVSQQFIESEGRTYLIEGEAINKNARACFRLPRWQELPGITP
ncbi:MAG: hypothetical protein V1892_03140 [bacterium]